MKVVVAFSGGKDSQASLIWVVKEMGVPLNKIEAVFCDTGWENPVTYKHITDVCGQMGVIFEEEEPDEDSRCMSHYKICE